LHYSLCGPSFDGLYYGFRPTVRPSVRPSGCLSNSLFEPITPEEASKLAEEIFHAACAFFTEKSELKFTVADINFKSASPCCVYLYMGMCLIALLLLSFMTNKVEYIIAGGGHMSWRWLSSLRIFLSIYRRQTKKPTNRHPAG